MRDPYSTPEQPDAADPNWRHPVESMEPMEDETFTMAEVAEAIFYILSDLKRAEKKVLLLDCMCLSVGLSAIYKESGESIAQKHAISRQRVHRVKEEVRDRLGVVGNAFAKRESAREGYRSSNKRNRKCLN